MAKVELKRTIVEEIRAMLDGATGAVLVDYRDKLFLFRIKKATRKTRGRQIQE